MAASSPKDAPSSTLVKTVYLIRHGEAIHNIQERLAKKQAGEEAEALGHARGSEAYKAACEVARKAVLKNEAFRDAPLSEPGIRQALSCRVELKKLAEGLGLEEPREVLVSPLQRTVQTAAAIFPDCPHVHVCTLLRERCTGLPCDECQPARNMCQRQSFAYMDWKNFVIADDGPNGEFEDSKIPASLLEDAAMLRLRTAEMGKQLRACSAKSICVTGHKGYLRELERGPFGRPLATEFETCEVRVYDVELPADGEMVARLRYCRDECSTLVAQSHPCCDAAFDALRDLRARPSRNLWGTSTPAIEAR
jgi:broad specificity phosphatase PhoE